MGDYGNAVRSIGFTTTASPIDESMKAPLKTYDENGCFNASTKEEFEQYLKDNVFIRNRGKGKENYA